MKTLTEFPVVTLKNVLKTRQELLAAGKTAEELPPAMGEALKLEGDKLTFILNAAELIESKLNDLKRVVVFALNEGEKAPQGAVQKGEQYYCSEYYPPLHPPKGKSDGKNDHGRDHKRGKKGGKRDGRRPPRRDTQGREGPGTRPMPKQG